MALSRLLARPPCICPPKINPGEIRGLQTRVYSGGAGTAGAELAGTSGEKGDSEDDGVLDLFSRDKGDTGTLSGLDSGTETLSGLDSGTETVSGFDSGT